MGFGIIGGVVRLGSLFSGGGGLGDLGYMMAGLNIQWQVEIDEYCQKILELRFPESDKYRDIKKVEPSKLKSIDILAGGFPCQPFSQAGKQLGEKDDRNLWPQMFRFIKELKPRYIIGENVCGVESYIHDKVFVDLENEGYGHTPMLEIEAACFGYGNKRPRIWFVAYADSIGWQKASTRLENRIHPEVIHQWEDDPITIRIEDVRYRTQGIPSYLRGHDGGSFALDRLKLLGNGQVVACTAFIGSIIMEFEGINEPNRNTDG